MNFYKNRKQRQLIVNIELSCFLSSLCFSSIISFIEAFGRLRIYFFLLPFLSESSKTCCFSTVLTLLLSIIVSVQLLTAPFHCSLCHSHRGCLVWVRICQNSEANILKASLPSICALLKETLLWSEEHLKKPETYSVCARASLRIGADLEEKVGSFVIYTVHANDFRDASKLKRPNMPYFNSLKLAFY